MDVGKLQDLIKRYHENREYVTNEETTKMVSPPVPMGPVFTGITGTRVRFKNAVAVVVAAGLGTTLLPGTES